MTETGIYGGSFNPIHRGHVELAERLCRDEGLDELWFMVSPQNPFKKSSPDLLNENIRLELARMAVREHPCLKVSDFEFRLPRPSYTADTLAALRQAYPDRLFTLVIGADNWLAFKDWKKPDEILSHHRILVYPRPGYAVEAASLPPGVEPLELNLLTVLNADSFGIGRIHPNASVTQEFRGPRPHGNTRAGRTVFARNQHKLVGARFRRRNSRRFHPAGQP